MQKFSQASTEEVSQFAGSVGCLIDRCMRQETPLGTVWLFDSDKVATSAHLLSLYADCLQALKIRFPAADTERAVASVTFHPKFNVKQSEQMARRALSTSTPGLSLQEHNLAVIHLGGGPVDISLEQANAINERLSSPAPSRDKGLGGSLAEIDLPLVIQTITNARKEGMVVLSDERNKPLAKMFCKDGKVMNAVYGSLANEAAIYQITSHHLSGNFHFASCRNPDWPAIAPILRPTDMLLIESARRLDEIPKLLLELGGDTTVYQRTAVKPNLEVLPPDVRKDAEAIWPFLDGRVPIRQLWRLVGLDDYAVFLVLTELLKANHIQEVQFAASKGSAPSPLPMAPEVPLAPFDEIKNLMVDPIAGQPVIAAGHLLGSLRPGDPWHLLHNIALPPDAAGSPIFKDGRVIGIHCGMLPANSTATAGGGTLNQLLWVESVYECMDMGRGSAPASDVTTRTGVLPAGCIEVARIDCPRCGSSSLDSAKFCKSCGQALIQDLDEPKPFLTAGKIKIAAAVLGLILVIGLGYWGVSSYHPPEPPPQGTPVNHARLIPLIEKADMKTAKWTPAGEGEVFHNGDLIALQMKLSKQSFLYVLHQGTNPTDINLLFPDSAANDMLYPEGASLSVPRETTTKTAAGTLSLSGLTVTGAPGSETLIFLVTDKPSALYTTPATVSKAFEIASKTLGQTLSPQGMELPTSAFGEDIFPQSTKAGNASPVYLTRLQISHRD
jgi:hypothetical protein